MTYMKGTKMGLFFNYDKPGPGIDKNAPKKKGIFLFLELLGRNLSNLLLSNMLYFIVSLRDDKSKYQKE